MLAVEDEIIPLFSKEHRRRFPEQDEGEAIAVLGSAVEEKSVWINAILDGAADQGEEVEHDGRAVRVCQEDLPEHVLNNRDQHEKRERNGDVYAQRPIGVAGREGVHRCDVLRFKC
jgi:hypothetical protein